MIFLDFEASSLDAGSYPIEIAWVDEDGQSESYLIQPHSSWHGWSAASAAIHHITQDMLRDGTPAVDVARRAHSVLPHAVVISDEPAFDQYWLEMLLNIIDAPPIRLYGLQELISKEITRVRSAVKTKDQQEWQRQTRTLLDQAQTVGMRAFEEAKRRHRHEHRALPDAQQHWHCWNAVRTAVDDLLDSVSDE
jgi:DNA polymerase III epsilon subunit-like protein